MSIASNAGESLSERVERLLERVEYRRAETSQDIETALRLRYDAYLREGAIIPNAEKKLFDNFDGLKNSHTFSVYIDGVLASSFRIHLLTPEHRTSPAMEAFPDFFEPALDAGHTFIDGNRFVANYDVARFFPELPFLTIRVPYMAAAYFNTDYISATVRAEHQAFYRRWFGLRVACPPRPYPTLTKPISLMLLDYKNGGKENILRKHPYFRSSPAERQRLFAPDTYGSASMVRRPASGERGATSRSPCTIAKRIAPAA
ncbi:MAG: hypothetical protein JOZ16_15725 [Methylobacteriaceae bacterium]|nr:hypothetical protein [Methylobacteriaceae bacterium]